MIEFRYAKAHHLLHHSLVSPEEISHIKNKLTSKRHSLLDRKAVILNQTDKLHEDHSHSAEYISQLHELIAMQKKQLDRQKLRFNRSHNRYMELGAYDAHKFSSSALTPDLGTAHVMYLKAHDWFDANELAEVEHGMHVMQTMEHPFMFSVIGAAQDATNLSKLHDSLSQQLHVLTEAKKTKRADVHARVLQHMQLCFEDELQMLSLLHHQQLHDWDKVQ